MAITYLVFQRIGNYDAGMIEQLVGISGITSATFEDNKTTAYLDKTGLTQTQIDNIKNILTANGFTFLGEMERD